MNTDQQTVLDMLERLRPLLPAVATMDDATFDRFNRLWQAAGEAVKDAVFVAKNPDNPAANRLRFELAAGAQALQNMIDILPELHALMVAHYDRFEPLSLLDVGSGTGAGVNLLAQLHSETMIWSRLAITAIDVGPWRRRWIASQYPRIDYRVMQAADLPARQWDFVVCSHVIEHVDDPGLLLEQVLRTCKGFALIYAPYNEIELSPGHLSTITEDVFAPHAPVKLVIRESMAFYGEGRRCILAVFDRRAGD